MTTPLLPESIEGPITGGTHGWAFGCSMLDLSAHGYREDEYILAGAATSYRHPEGFERSFDGRWEAEPSGTAPYTTRILVQAPTDPSRFSGTVVVMWNNVTAGYELFDAEWESAFEAGHAVVSVTCQRVAIEGLPGLDQGMGHWDPERYGSLSITSDDFSYDIFSQAARAVGPDRARGSDRVDPLQGLDARRLVAFGASQSAGRLSTYLNAIQPQTNVFDAVLLAIYFGSSTELEVGDRVVNIMSRGGGSSTQRALTGRNLVRDDLDCKAMVVNSELEAIACVGVRQPDNDRFRWWESAGTCHVSAQSLEARAEKYRRDFGKEPPARAGNPNRIPIKPLYDAALHHVHSWLTTGEAPPSQPKVTFEGEPPEIVRDDDDIAVGGIRLPQVQVPLGYNGAIPASSDIFALLNGSTRPFGAGELRDRYGDVTSYLSRFEAAVDACEEQGVLLDRHRKPLLEEAREAFEAATTSGGR